jgi:hypothetical protein
MLKLSFRAAVEEQEPMLACGCGWVTLANEVQGFFLFEEKRHEDADERDVGSEATSDRMCGR